MAGSRLQRAEVKEPLGLFSLALLITIGAGIWAWMLASGQFAPAPVIPDPGHIAIVLDAGNSLKEAGIRIDVTYSASISQRSTSITIAFGQQSGSGKASSPPPTIMVLLCGMVAQNPRYTNDQRQMTRWHQAALLDGAYYSDIGSMGLCQYTTVRLTADGVGGQYRSALLTGYSGMPPTQISGAGVIYAWPGVVTTPSGIADGGFKISPLPEGSTLAVHLSNPPTDLSNVVASPQLPDSGILQWQAPFFGSTPLASQYRISGNLQNRQVTEQRSIFLAGALVGVAGGGAIWLLQLLPTLVLAVIRPSDATTTNNPGTDVDTAARTQEATTHSPIPWLLRLWPLIIVGSAVTTMLVLLAVLIDSDVTRVALPAIAGAIGTIALAVVTLRLSISERAHQDQLRRADELARRTESDHQQAIKAAEERASNERERELEVTAATRQARRIAAFGGWEGDVTAPKQPGVDTLTLVNGSEYPIFDIGLIGARSEVLGDSINHDEWPPELRLEGESLYVAVLLPGERHIFRGRWKWRKDFVLKGGKLMERRATYTWTDDQGRAWQRDGKEPPSMRTRPWVWMEFWGNSEYQDTPTTET